jgi:hypothetical protein
MTATPSFYPTMTRSWKSGTDGRVYMDDVKFLLRDARDQINLELRKLTRRVAAEIYAEVEQEVLEQYENFVELDISPAMIRLRMSEAIRDMG